MRRTGRPLLRHMLPLYGGGLCCGSAAGAGPVLQAVLRRCIEPLCQLRHLCGGYSTAPAPAVCCKLGLAVLTLLLVLFTTGSHGRPADTSLALQVAVVYYGVALLLHCLVPAALPVKSIQAQPRQPGQASREALYSLGARVWGVGLGLETHNIT